MPARIPISAASDVGKKHKCKQVILLAFDDEGRTHVTTWGRSADDCAQAAAGGNMLKKKWGWPECNDQPSRVRELQSEVSDLRDRIKEMQACLEVKEARE
jgi:hypothetical protein